MLRLDEAAIAAAHAQARDRLPVELARDDVQWFLEGYVAVELRVARRCAAFFDALTFEQLVDLSRLCAHQHHAHLMRDPEMASRCEALFQEAVGDYASAAKALN